MDIKNYKNLWLNGQYYSEEALHILTSEKLQQPKLAAHEKSLFQFIAAWISNQDSIFCNTSGSTGIPQKISMEKTKMLASAALSASFFQWQKNDNFLLALSPDHIGGKMMIVRAFFSGCQLWQIAPSMDTNLFELPQIHFTALVPTQVQKLCKHSENIKWLRSIKQVIVGGAPVSPHLKQQINNFPNAIYETFGMTETISHVALKLIAQNSKDAHFRTLGNTNVATTPDGQLILNAPHLGIFDLLCNDVVKCSNPHTFEWLGRRDNVINSGGKKIYPEVVEAKIGNRWSMPFFIAAKNDELWGEKVVIVLETEKDHDNILNIIQPVLEKHEMPKEVIKIKKFEYTANGKIKRKATLEKLV